MKQFLLIMCALMLMLANMRSCALDKLIGSSFVHRVLGDDVVHGVCLQVLHISRLQHSVHKKLQQEYINEMQKKVAASQLVSQFIAQSCNSDDGNDEGNKEILELSVDIHQAVACEDLIISNQLAVSDSAVTADQHKRNRDTEVWARLAIERIRKQPGMNVYSVHVLGHLVAYEMRIVDHLVAASYGIDFDEIIHERNHVMRRAPRSAQQAHENIVDMATEAAAQQAGVADILMQRSQNSLEKALSNKDKKLFLHTMYDLLALYYAEIIK